MKTIKKLRYIWMRLRYRVHLLVRRVHDRLFARKKRYYRFHQKPYAKHVIRGLKAVSVVLVLVASIGLFNIFQPGRAWAASVYSWVQTDWTCGADTSNFPVHPTNKTTWCKFFSKDSSVSTSTAGTVTLNSGSSAFTDNTTAGFNAGTKNNVGVNANQALLLKPTGATAANDYECKTAFRSGGVCAPSPWIAGQAESGYPTALVGKYIYNVDAAGTPAWKNANTSCVGPQCSTTVAPAPDVSYPSNMVLVDPIANSGVVFGATYPAQEACKALGGRLPTMNELLAIYAGKVAGRYGTFQSTYYWSATEYNSSNAYFVYFSNGGTYNGNKNGTNFYTRCVR